MPSDSFTEVTSQSWFSRLGSAIKGVVIGAILFLVAFPLLFWNEGRAVKTAKSLAEGAASVVSVGADKIDQTNDGKLIHITGKAETDETLTDSQFGVSANAVRLTRQVAMYQWVERKKQKDDKQLGGSKKTTTTYDYTTEWSTKLHDSSRFHKPAGHTNPTTMPYKEVSTTAKDVHVGVFKLSSSLVGQFSGGKPLDVSTDALPADLARRLQAVVANGSKGFYIPTAPSMEPPKPQAAPTADGTSPPTGGEPTDTAASTTTVSSGPSLPALSSLPSNPTVGDLHITFEVIEPTEVSVIAAQTGETFQPYQTEAGNALNMLAMGTKDAATMFADAEAANKMMTWVLRVVGFMLMAVGLGMVLHPLSVLGDIIPLLGSLIGMGTSLVAGVCALGFSLLTISIAWLFYRPLIGVPLFLLGLAALFLLFRMVLQRRRSQAEAV